MSVAIAVLPAGAQMVPKVPPALARAVVPPAGFVATVAPEPLAVIEHELDPATRADIAAFRAQAGGDWRMYVDRRSGAMALVEGSGIPWLAEQEGAPLSARKATVTRLEAKARDLVRRFPNLFKVAPEDLVLDRRGTVNLGETGQLWSVVFHQRIAGVQVDGARVVFRVSHGNLVQFGVDRTIPTLSPYYQATRVDRPALDAAQARAALSAHVGGLLSTDKMVEDGSLVWVARGRDDRVGYGGPVGYGWDPVLVYRFAFVRAGDRSSWLALVDARHGAVVRFIDANAYQAVVGKESVYTSGNCVNPLDCVPGSAAEVAVTAPFARVTFAGGTCTGDGCFTNAAGSYVYPPGAVSSTTTLDGKYFTVIDACGSISASAAAPNGFDLGTSNPSGLGTNTDCFAANRHSPPDTSPTTGGPGDTHAARNTYYHLNLIGQKARAYLPGNVWLEGIDAPGGAAILVNTNLPPACNAFWQGTTGSLNFLKVTPGLFCNNTGEILDVFLHEFGHGLDQNDATGTAPESATGEAMGDTFAILETQRSCVGPGMFLFNPTSPNWGNRAGYGSGSALCTGVRDADYTRFCMHGSGAGCTAAVDPDAPNGSRSGLTPPPNPLDAGTPARYNHMIQTAPVGVADGQSNFYACGGPESTGCAGPLNHGCHCESTIASQANFDLAKQLIASEFGGNIYATPQGPLEVSGWQYMDRLWYLTRDLAVSAYAVTGPAPAGTTNGCGIGNWFPTYRFVDDDNGNLADGTPHADIIFDAFSLHAMACGNENDPENQGAGCPAPIAAPVLSTCASPKVPVQLTWTASPGATQYRVLRNTLGCGFGFQPIAVVGASQLYYEDAEVAPGVPYYYSVQPVGANPSCYGFASNCLTVTPTACGLSTLPAPTGVSLLTPGANQIRVNWNAVAGAASYKVMRRMGGCAGSGSYTAVGVVQAPTTTFLDGNGIMGTVTYSYQVLASDGSCGSCTSPPSACQQITATGSCAIAPSFAGATSVVAGAIGECKLTVNWGAGTASCAGPLSYDIHRSTSAGFLPSAANRIASVAATSYVDWAVQGGTRYYYIVRARDGFGNTDANTVRRSEVPVGTLSPGTFVDNAGDSGSVHFTPSPTINNEWTILPNGTGNGTRHYATNPATPPGTYQTNACQGLESETLFLKAGSTLSFTSRYDIEQGWDGGYVEVSTEAGGFANWSKLTTVNYPGVMSGPLGDPACGGAGFADGQPVFTGTSTGWSTFSGSLSAYNNQRVRIRFLFSSDGASEQTGWFVDNIQVTNVDLPGACLGEVSGRGSPAPLRLVKNGPNGIGIIFEDLGDFPVVYNVYHGTSFTPYNHTATPAQDCHNDLTLPGTPGPGERTWVNYPMPPGSFVYFLVNASNGSVEGVLGTSSSNVVTPLPTPSCGP